MEFFDSLEPLIFTPEEEAEMEAYRQARKAWEKARFNQYAEEMRRIWE